MADLTIVFSNSWGSGILMVIVFAKPLLADDDFIIYMTDDYDDHSSSKLRKFRKFTYIMNPSYSRPVCLDPLFSQPVSLCVTCFTPVN